MITLNKITYTNLNFAVKVHREIFPSYSARINYEEATAGVTDNEYFLIYNKNVCIGIIGIYSCPADKDSAWLGWFGIREKFRRRHLGTEALKLYEKMALEKGFTFARLYTDRFNNETAISFYKYNGYTPEIYVNEKDNTDVDDGVLIFSKSLTTSPLVPWNNRDIQLTEQLSKQKIN